MKNAKSLSVIETLIFRVDGVPRPKGSYDTFFNRKAKRYVFINRSKGLKDWNDRVCYVARQLKRGKNLWKGPVSIDVDFFMPIPKKSSLSFPTGPRDPDTDKLIRALGDALTGILFDDDKQIVKISATKQYGDPGAMIHANLLS